MATPGIFTTPSMVPILIELPTKNPAKMKMVVEEETEKGENRLLLAEARVRVCAHEGRGECPYVHECVCTNESRGGGMCKCVSMCVSARRQRGGLTAQQGNT